MSIYKSLFDSLEDFPTLYRFQGGKSASRIIIDRTSIIFPCKSFIYVSKSLAHHQYFSLKRISQDLSFQGLDKYTFRIKNWDDVGNALILLKDKPLDFEATSLSIKVFPFFWDLVKSNCQVNKGNNIKIHRKIELSDRTIRGGGFGFPDEWLQLFGKSIVVVKKKCITPQSIKNYLASSNDKTENEQSKMSFFEYPPHNYFVNQSIFNDFSKYDILNLLEEIVEKNMTKEGSELNTSPKSTIKKLIYSYQADRNEVLKRLKDFEE